MTAGSVPPFVIDSSAQMEAWFVLAPPCSVDCPARASSVLMMEVGMRVPSAAIEATYTVSWA